MPDQPEPAAPAVTPGAAPGRQPWLHGLVAALAAPTQLWCGPDGDIGGDVGGDGAGGAQGVYEGDVRVLSVVRVEVGGESPTPVLTTADDASGQLAVAVARHLGDPTPDPTVRLERRRTVRPGVVEEQLVLRSTASGPLRTTVVVRLAGDLAGMDDVKRGRAGPPHPPSRAGGAGPLVWERGPVRAEVTPDGSARCDVRADGADLTWQVDLPPGGVWRGSWSLAARDAAAVVLAPPAPAGWAGQLRVRADDSRLARWVHRSLADLEALRLVTPGDPGSAFVGAGAPWYLTLFGRDALWTARMLLPLGTDLAASTLRVLAARQGRRDDPATAEQPGRILHELRREGAGITPGRVGAGPAGSALGAVALPPTYYGTVDATSLWVCLLHDAWRAGMPEDQVEALLPSLEAALAWQVGPGDSDGDGFLEYVDRSGRGLSNQGWKDSHDSVQWRDGRLAEAPIALCEVQGYAHEAAVGGAALLDRFDRPGADRHRAWAEQLRARFRERFWVDGAGAGGAAGDGAGPYPAIALDAAKRPVDSLTSNIGHLLGTGLLDDAEEAVVAAHLLTPAVSAGYGLRTLSADMAGFSPLSYHTGSVWVHDTAVAVTGLARGGHAAAAAELAEGLLAAAEAFGYRVPELHGGEARADAPVPVPYPASCRPQAWAAASAVAVLGAVLGLEPAVLGGTAPARPLRGVTGAPVLGAVEADGVVVAGRPARAVVARL